MRNPFPLKLTLMVFTFSLAGGCAHREMDSVIASWQKQPVSAVIAAWGDPSEDLTLEGKRLLLWRTAAGKPVPAETQRPSSPASDGYCVRLLKADNKGRIVDGTWDGNDCPGWFSGWAR